MLFLKASLSIQFPKTAQKDEMPTGGLDGSKLI